MREAERALIAAAAALGVTIVPGTETTDGRTATCVIVRSRLVDDAPCPYALKPLPDEAWRRKGKRKGRRVR